jgi:hypothetical protein
LGWHYYENLEGFALVGIAGLTLSDSVMLFCAYWQIKSASNAERITPICKFLIAITVVTIAVLVIADSAAKKVATKKSADQSGKPTSATSSKKSIGYRYTEN